MNISCIQMDMLLGDRAENFARAEALIEAAMAEQPDVIVLPELWDVGFFPREDLPSLCDGEGSAAQAFCSRLAKKHRVNLVAGSVATLREGKVYNTAMVFDRQGVCLASYDKSHLFSPMGEDKFFTAGQSLCTFLLDGVKCGIILCYDLRFPELARSLALMGAELLFVPAQWPKVRVEQFGLLLAARAVENQLFCVGCNSCGNAYDTVYGGASGIFDPTGKAIARAGEERNKILTAACDLQMLESVRKSIPVFHDRRPEIYKI